MSHDHMQQMTTDGPGFITLWNPHYMLLLFVVGYLYLRVIRKGYDRFADAQPVTSLQKFSFLMGLFMLYVALGSPLAYYGHHFLFSAHMFQQSVLFMIVPPLILLGTPAWLLRPYLDKRKKLVKLVTNPFLALLTFNALFSIYHMPIVFDAVMAYPVFHAAYHLVLFVTAFQMWWLITCPVPEYNRLTHLKKMGFIFADGVLLTPACGLIIFAGQPLYSTYLNAPQLLYFLPTLDDQQLGGVVMKLIQEFAYGTGLWYVFYQWYRKENPPDKYDEIVSVEPAEEPFLIAPQPAKQ